MCVYVCVHGRCMLLSLKFIGRFEWTVGIFYVYFRIGNMFGVGGSSG